MVKHIELNPEWVLSELSISLYADGCGKISVETDTINDAKWIKLALETLLIPYDEKEYSDGDTIFIDIEFHMEDLRSDCPNLYKRLKEMDTKNKIYRSLNIN